MCRGAGMGKGFSHMGQAKVVKRSFGYHGDLDFSLSTPPKYI